MDVVQPRSKYLLAFCNPLYSDCSLNLYTNGTAEKGRGPRAVPASSAILASNSKFFEKMLSGNFKESSNKTSIDIHLEAPSDECFMDLLLFMHTETLPPEASSSLHKATELLILADRFEVGDCVAACARELKSLPPITSSQDALLVLSLPQSLREDPRLKRVVIVASLFLVNHSSFAVHQAGTRTTDVLRILHPVLNEKGEAVRGALLQDDELADQYTRQARQDLLDYPESAMEAVLESKRLEADSEDSVATAALAWAMHQSTSPEQVLDTLFSFILPRLCLRSLSPRFLQSLLPLLTKPCCSSQSQSQSQQLALTLSGCKSDAAASPPSPGMAPSTPTRAAASESESLYSPGTSSQASQPPGTLSRASQPQASLPVPQSGDEAAHATSLGVGAPRLHNPLMDPPLGRDEASDSASYGEDQAGRRAADGEHQRAGRRGLRPREGNPCLSEVGVASACHPSCSAFVARGRDVLPLCITMCQGATARPEAVAAALGVFADALVDLSEQNLLRTGALAKGCSFRKQQAHVPPLLLPPRSVALPSGCLCLDVPWSIIEAPLTTTGYSASNCNLVVSTPGVLASGRWLKLAVYLKNFGSTRRLEVYLDNSAEMQVMQESYLGATINWRFCIQTSSSQPAFESYASGTLFDEVQAENVCHIPLTDEGKKEYFCQNMLRMRVDTWST